MGMSSHRLTQKASVTLEKGNLLESTMFRVVYYVKIFRPIEQVEMIMSDKADDEIT